MSETKATKELRERLQSVDEIAKRFRKISAETEDQLRAVDEAQRAAAIAAARNTFLFD